MASPFDNQSINNTFPSQDAPADSPLRETFSRLPVDTNFLVDTATTTSLTCAELILVWSYLGTDYVPYPETGWVIVFPTLGASASILGFTVSTATLNWKGAIAGVVLNTPFYVYRPRIPVAYPFDKGRVLPVKKTEFDSGVEQRRPAWSTGKRLYTIRTNPLNALQALSLRFFLLKVEFATKAFYLLDPYDDRYVAVRLQDDAFTFVEFAPPRLSQTELKFIEVFPRVSAIYPTGGGTADAGSSAYQLLDSALIGNTGIAPGWTIYMTSGANIGRSRIIRTFTSASGIATWEPRFQSAVSAGDTYRIEQKVVQIP